MVYAEFSSLFVLVALIGFWKVKFYDEYYNVEIFNEYDFIVVGAGTSGSVVASRLSEIENTTVLLVEAGDAGHGEVNIEIPFLASLLPFTKRDWGLFSTPQKHSNNRTVYYVRGKTGGGSSAVNYMIYVRGSKHDYNGWSASGAEGWAFKDVEKYFKRVERLSDSDLSSELGKHGTVPLTRGFHILPFYNFISSAIQEIGYSAVDYISGAGILQGISKVTFTALDGVRQHAAQSYLWPVYEQRKSRLHFSFKSLAHRIVLEEIDGVGVRAVGVLFESKQKFVNVRAKKEVIVCAGVINSPQLLMLSGIGPRSHIANFFEPIVDLPGVGTNFQDHVGMTSYYYGKNIPRNLVKDTSEAMEGVKEYLKNGNALPGGTPIFTSAIGNFILNSTEHRLPAVPNVQMVFNAIKNESPQFWQPVSQDFVDRTVRQQNGIFSHFVVAPTVLRTKSHGTVRLKSSSANDLPEFNPNIFSHPDDFLACVESMRVLERLEKTAMFKNYGIKMVKHPACEIFYSDPPRSDEYYKCHIKQTAYPYSHGCCTNKMGKRTDAMAVVDSRLRVFGVHGLRVADASIMPHLVSGNTQAPCYMIGEKASDLIKEDWGYL